MKHFFVINPHSFRDYKEKQNRVIREIKNCFSGGRETEYDIYISRFPRDAAGAIYHFVNRFPKNEVVRVYAVGGDGILFECLNGVVDFPNAELAAIPYGGTNDFVRAFGENAQPAFLNIKKMTTAPTNLVDIINCGSNCAINQVAIGIEAQALINANKLLRDPRFDMLKKRASFLYQIGAISAVFNKETSLQHYEIEMDGEDVSGVYCSISISNTACMGGTMFSCPYAKPNDGVLDGIFTKGGKALTVIRYIDVYTKGHYEKNNAFFRKQFRKLEIRSDVLLRVHIDGESFYTNEMKMEIIPGRIKFCVPEGQDFEDYSYKAYKSPVKQ